MTNEKSQKQQEVLGRTNLATFPMATIAILTVCDVTILTYHLNTPKALLCKAENHTSNNFEPQPF
jgi:hypothetical protein